MEREGACRKERLASMASSVIFRCRCGIYHVRVNGTTLHLTASQFNVTARLFKLALGMSAGQRGVSSPVRIGVGKQGSEILRIKEGAESAFRKGGHS